MCWEGDKPTIKRNRKENFMKIKVFKKAFETYRAVLIELENGLKTWIPKTNLDLINNQIYNKSALWNDLNTKNEISDGDELDVSLWEGFTFKFQNGDKQVVAEIAWNKDLIWKEVLDQLKEKGF